MAFSDIAPRMPDPARDAPETDWGGDAPATF
jgi:hypothetical protein